MSDTYSKGDRVTVTYSGTVKGTEILGHGLGRGYVIRTDDGFEHTVHAYGCSGIMQREKPQNWPPRPGDVWTANGMDWYAVHADDGVLMVPQNLRTYTSCNPEKLSTAYSNVHIKIRGTKFFAE